MSLAMLSQHASYEFRWRRWALLHDTVATHLEGANPGSRFRNFASIGRALGGSVQIPAAALAAEIREIRDALTQHPVDDLMLGPITASILYPTAKAPEASRRLTRHELTQVAPIGDEKMLDRYFASMLDSMLEVCEHPMPDGTIEVHDG